MRAEDVIIATITLARNEEEENELKKSLQQLALLNIPVIIADGGSIASFMDFITGISQFTILATKQSGVLAQAKASVLAAYETNTPFIFYTEPDKKDFFNTGLAKKEDGTPITWVVGWIEENRHPYFFVLNMETKNSTINLQEARMTVLKNILTQLNFFKGRR